MTERHSELASAVESGSAELAIYNLAFMLDDRLQELTNAISRLTDVLNERLSSHD